MELNNVVEEIIEEIRGELVAAILKHPRWPSDDIIHAVAIMAEESGEATKASLDLTYGVAEPEELKKELLQTAAMAIRVIMNMEYK